MIGAESIVADRAQVEWYTFSLPLLSPVVLVIVFLELLILIYGPHPYLDLVRSWKL